MKYGSYLVSILLLLGSVSTMANNTQNLDILKKVAENYVLSALGTNSEQRTEVSSGNIDPRLRLNSCNDNLTAFTPPGSNLHGNTTVGIRCTGKKFWSIYIPVRIAVFQQAIVATGKMARGQLISANDITLEEVDISKIRGQSFTNKNDLVGTKLKISVQVNQVIDSATVCLICKGDSVVITANSSVIAVSMAGVALNDGSKGDKIRVQNNSSRRIIDAVVTDNTTVKAGI